MAKSSFRKSHKTTKWRQYQQKRATFKRLSLAFVCLGILLVIIFVGFVFSFFRSISSPMTNRENIGATTRLYQWDGQSTLNIVVKTNSVYALSYHPPEKELVILKFPDDTYVTLPQKYGSWPTRSVYQLGQAEQPPIGAQLLKTTIEMNLGVPVDGFIYFDSDEEFLTTIKNLRKNPMESATFIKSIESDLSPLELGKLVWGWWGVRLDKIKMVDLGTSQITESILLPDGSRALGMNKALIDQLMQREFVDSRVSDEGLSVSIYNSTDVPGLAEKAARIVTNLGGRVIYQGNTKEKHEKSLIFSKSQNDKSYTKLRLGQIFAQHCLVKPSFWSKNDTCSLDKTKEVIDRGDVTIILGEDYGK
jgi:hypothetical protein